MQKSHCRLPSFAEACPKQSHEFRIPKAFIGCDQPANKLRERRSDIYSHIVQHLPKCQLHFVIINLALAVFYTRHLKGTFQFEQGKGVLNNSL